MSGDSDSKLLCQFSKAAVLLHDLHVIAQSTCSFRQEAVCIAQVTLLAYCHVAALVSCGDLPNAFCSIQASLLLAASAVLLLHS